MGLEETLLNTKKNIVKKAGKYVVSSLLTVLTSFFSSAYPYIDLKQEFRKFDIISKYINDTLDWYDFSKEHFDGPPMIAHPPKEDKGIKIEWDKSDILYGYIKTLFDKGLDKNAVAAELFDNLKSSSFFTHPGLLEKSEYEKMWSHPEDIKKRSTEINANFRVSLDDYVDRKHTEQDFTDTVLKVINLYRQSEGNNILKCIKELKENPNTDYETKYWLNTSFFDTNLYILNSFMNKDMVNTHISELEEQMSEDKNNVSLKKIHANYQKIKGISEKYFEKSMEIGALQKFTKFLESKTKDTSIQLPKGSTILYNYSAGEIDDRQVGGIYITDWSFLHSLQQYVDITLGRHSLINQIEELSPTEQGKKLQSFSDEHAKWNKRYNLDDDLAVLVLTKYNQYRHILRDSEDPNFKFDNYLLSQNQFEAIASNPNIFQYFDVMFGKNNRAKINVRRAQRNQAVEKISYLARKREEEAREDLIKDFNEQAKMLLDKEAKDKVFKVKSRDLYSLDGPAEKFEELSYSDDYGSKTADVERNILKKSTPLIMSMLKKIKYAFIELGGAHLTEKTKDILLLADAYGVLGSYNNVDCAPRYCAFTGEYDIPTDKESEAFKEYSEFQSYLLLNEKMLDKTQEFINSLKEPVSFKPYLVKDFSNEGEIETVIDDIVKNEEEEGFILRPKAYIMLGTTPGNFETEKQDYIYKEIINKMGKDDIFILGVDLNTDVDAILEKYKGKTDLEFKKSFLTAHGFNPDDWIDSNSENPKSPKYYREGDTVIMEFICNPAQKKGTYKDKEARTVIKYDKDGMDYTLKRFNEPDLHQRIDKRNRMQFAISEKFDPKIHQKRLNDLGLHAPYMRGEEDQMAVYFCRKNMFEKLAA